MTAPIRVLIGKPGLDGHNRGARVVVQALRDAGMEVIYTGIRRTPEQIVEAAVTEDVDAVGVSSLSGAHLTLFPKIAELMREQGANDVLLFCGGVIPEDDRPLLEKAGYKGIFGPDTPTGSIVDFVRKHARARGQ
ncbi:MAG TPA: cobalamin B12-binding domain-containing protein [Planctomycetota bacterium]|nr:cobalamin B12-binding domain-containing protein [Planctomycetota bacterium]